MTAQFEKGGEMNMCLEFKDYLKAPGISCSQLKYLNEKDGCPQKFKYFVLDDNAKKETDAMRLGSAFHARVLEPATFDKEFLVTPKIRKSGAAWGALQLSAGSRSILWTDEEDKPLQEMRDKIKDHETANDLLTDTINEVSIFWETNGIKCRGRIDAIKRSQKGVTLIDIKTTTDASQSGFSREVFKRQYHMQAAYYMDGYHAATGVKPEMFVFIAIEKAPPYLIDIFYLKFKNDSTTEQGRTEYNNALDLYRKCNDEDDWSLGYGGSKPVLLPAYYT